jgi:hypothetical protein
MHQNSTQLVQVHLLADARAAGILEALDAQFAASLPLPGPAGVPWRGLLESITACGSCRCGCMKPEVGERGA